MLFSLSIDEQVKVIYNSVQTSSGLQGPTIVGGAFLDDTTTAKSNHFLMHSLPNTNLELLAQLGDFRLKTSGSMRLRKRFA